MPMGPAPAMSTREPPPSRRPPTPFVRGPGGKCPHRSPWTVEFGLADRGDADGQRLAQCRGVVGHRVRHRVRELRADGHVVAECAVDRRGGEEPHMWAQVVVAAARLIAVRIGPLRFDGHPLTDPRRVDRFADANDRARRLVSEDQGPVHDETTHPAMPVVVRIRATDTHRRDPNQHVTGLRRRHRPLLHLDSALLDKHSGPHPCIGRKCCVRHIHHVSVMSIYSHP